MKRKVLALLLCLCVCLNWVLPVMALGESNTLGVTFNAALDQPVLATSDQAETVTLSVNTSKPVTLEGIGAYLYWDEALTITSISNTDPRIDFKGSYNLEKGILSWDGTDDLDQLENVTNIVTATFSVPANTPAGSYKVGVKDIEVTTNYGSNIWENKAYAEATLTITDASVGAYTAGVTALTNVLSVGDTVSINIGVSHTSETVYAAAEIELTYDSEKLAFNQSKSTIGNATIKNADRTLVLEDYGANKNTGTGIYVLVFDVIKDGTASVELTSAGFINKENAVKSDLVAATLTSTKVNLTINKRSYDVTLPDIFTGASTAVEGENYTFAQADKDNYTYENVKATVGNTEVAVTDNQDGTYTVADVTGKLVITGSRTPKSYDVTISGNAANEIQGAAAKATYGTAYTFTIPNVEGWAYSVDSITIGGQAYTGYSVSGNTYTIPGTAINGAVVITVSKSQTQFKVTVEGNGAGVASGYNTIAQVGKSYTLAIVPEKGYDYTVTATMNNQPVALKTDVENQYTIENVTGNIVFTITRTVNADGISVSKYLTVDGCEMWLVKNSVALADGKVPTYDGNKMFWSEKYNAYCCLALTQTLTKEEAGAKVDITDGSAITVDYGCDVNMTGVVDACDAQLVYNMYNAVYRNFDADVTVEKFLRADINGDGSINVEDAVAIIAVILNKK